MSIFDGVRSKFAQLIDPTQQRGRETSPHGSGNITGGGIVNHVTGAGTHLDKSEGSFFQPTRIAWRTPLEILCVQSWAAANFVDIPVDDMFIRWRKFVDDDEKVVEAMEEAEARHKVSEALSKAMCAARQYGTGVVVILTAEAPPEEPLIPERVREGDLRSLHYFDRYDLSVSTRERDMFSPNYGQPIFYDLHPTHGNPPMRVHHTRILRFDGISPTTRSGFTIYDQDFGVSNLIPIIISILQDQAFTSGISHMSQEASMPVLHISGLRDTIAGLVPGQIGPYEIGDAVNKMKSIYRLLMLDAKSLEDFERITINFSGLADLMDKWPARIAAAAKIPITRFLGSPPVGMNATGEGDMNNYVLMFEAMRAKILPAKLEVLDKVLARDVGLRDPPEYEWQSIIDISDKEIAIVSKTKMEAVEKALQNNLIDEDEGRQAINNDPVFGDLSGDAPELEDPPIHPAPESAGSDKDGEESD